VNEAGATVSSDQGSSGLAELAGTVYGVQVRGRLPEAFRRYLRDGSSPGRDEALEVSFRTVGRLPESDEIWHSEAPVEAGGERFALFRSPGGFGLSVSAAGRGLFLCTRAAMEIVWSTPAGSAPHYFTSHALPLWLEWRGVPVLHASAVTVAGTAVAFVGPSGAGKSVLCAELLRLGCGFVADDGLALRRTSAGAWSCSPGPPLVRLWPSGLQARLGVSPAGLPRALETTDKRSLRPEDAADAAIVPQEVPVGALYLLERHAGAGEPVTTSACHAREALVRLIEHGVAAAAIAALGLSARRLELLAGLVEEVPVRRLAFPSAADSAAGVRDAIRRDLAKDGSGA